MGGRRYAHAECMLREAEKDPNYEKKEIVNPLDNVVCIYCKKSLNRNDADCVMVTNGKYAHQACVDIEAKRELTDKEKLDQYIKQLFKSDYVSPQIQKQIKRYAEEYNFTYSGMLKALVYFYEVKGNSLEKANGGVGIIPYIYKDAYNYYYKLWLAQQKHEDIEVQNYIPVVKEIVIPRPKPKIKKRQLFTFLDDEVDNGQ